MENPFVIRAYESKDLFCDREEELQLMLRNCVNNTDMTLISQRRMGKTGLILRLFDELKETRPDINTVYIDIFASRHIGDFIKLTAEAAMKSFQPKTSITLRGLFEFLDSQGERIVIAIDEFQQIRDYPELNMEALLRTYIQQSRNLTFIFCGSKKHMMADIFANEKKPFYNSTAFMSLGKIPEAAYSAFIRRLLSERQRSITDDALQFILDWTRRHTYYTQQLCHTIYAGESLHITIDDVKKACEQLMRQGEAVFLQYRQMLTDKQWNYLIAIAKEGSVSQITASRFLKDHQIGTPSVSRRLADALCEKGLLNDDVTLVGTSYSVSDVFLSRWMERL